MTEKCPFVTFEPQPTEKVSGIAIYKGITEKIDPPLFIGRVSVSCTECPLQQTVFSIKYSELTAKVNAGINAELYVQRKCQSPSSEK